MASPSNLFVDSDPEGASLDSTGPSEHSSDHYFEVDEVLAEREIPEEPGETEFLVSWTGYPLDRATWEPTSSFREHIVLDDWLAAKAEIDAGTRQPFDIRVWADACAEAIDKRVQRHRRRNAERKRRGLPLTEPLLDDHAFDADPDFIKEGSSSEDEPMIDAPQPGTPPLSSDVHSPPRRQPTNEQGTSSVTSAEPHLEGPTRETRRSPASPRAPASRASNAPSQGQQISNYTKPNYQGTAYTGTSRPSQLHKTPGKVAGGERPPTNLLKRSTAHVLPERPPVSSKPSKTSTDTSGLPARPDRSKSSATKASGSTLRGKLGAKTAIKSKPRQTASVFITGKQRGRPQGSGLWDAMTDPSKPSSIFKNSRLVNVARKKAIERNETAPELSAIPTAFIVNREKNPSSSIQPAENFVQSPTEELPAAEPSASAAGRPKLKKKKSVRFTDVDDNSDRPSRVLKSPERETTADADRVPAPAKKLSLTDYRKRSAAKPPVNTQLPARRDLSSGYQGVSPEHSSPIEANRFPTAAGEFATGLVQGPVQTVTKLCTFGASSPSHINFTGVPDAMRAGAPTFFDSSLLEFNYSCAAHDFIGQRFNLITKGFCHGSVQASDDTESILTNVTNNLRTKSRGLYLATSVYSILLFSSGSGEWNELIADLQLNSPEDATPRLHYLLFECAFSLNDYPPIAPPGGHFKPGSMAEAFKAAIGMTTDLDFAKVLPLRQHDVGRQVFMLMILDDQLLRLVAFWLRACQPNCEIYTSRIEGAYAMFIDKTAGKTGTIILSDDIAQIVHTVPRICELTQKNYSFWCLSTSSRARPLFGDIETPLMKHGEHRLTQMFPRGRVVCPTPSFIVTRPQEFCRLMKWFSAEYRRPGYLLVVPRDFSAWLSGLIEQKCVAKDKLEKRFPSHDPRLRQELESQGLEHWDIQCLVKARNIFYSMRQGFDDISDEGDATGIRVANVVCSPSDEQSLVNSFLCFAQTQADSHRYFYVVGSHGDDRSRAYLRVQIPDYIPSQTLDANESAHELDKARELKATSLYESWKRFMVGRNVNMDGYSPEFPPVSDMAQGNPRPMPHGMFTADKLPDIYAWLRSLDKTRTFQYGYTNMHPEPITWNGRADTAADSDGITSSLSAWLDQCPTFTRTRNTHLGLFCTMDGTIAAPNQAGTQLYRSWIAVYRPLRPHKYPHDDASELLIWDPEIPQSTEEALDLSQLCDAQKALVELIETASPSRIAQCRLTRIWISNAMPKDADEQSDPLDLTCHQFHDFVEETPFWLPPTGTLLLERSWKMLDLGRSRAVTQAEPSEERSQLFKQPFPKIDSDDAESWSEHDDVAMVYPPGRGHTDQVWPKRSRATNYMYEEAYKARLKDPTCTSFELLYPATLDWYHKLKKEGRHSAQVWVDSWRGIFPKLKNMDQVK